MKMEDRYNDDFCNAWYEYTSEENTAPLFREWAALMVVSGALTRRVWINTSPRRPALYPNLYVMLIGRPGSGKDNAINQAIRIWQAAFNQADPTWGVNVGTQSPTAKGLIDALNHDNAKLYIDYGSRRELFHSVFICAPELTTVLPEYNPRLVGIMCELYNCNPSFGEQVRNGKGEPLVIERPHTIVFVGGQPSTLVSSFPEEAFEMGLFSRMILVHSPEIHKQNMYPDKADTMAAHNEADSLWKALTHDVQQMSRLVGKIKVPSKLQAQINKFHLTDSDKTALSYSRFEDYNTRRSLNAQKMAMCYCASRGASMELAKIDWERALDLLFRTERLMPSIFSNIRSSRGFHSTIEEVIHSASDTKLLSESDIIRQIRKKHPPHEIPAIINSMIVGGDLEVVEENKGIRTFRVKGDLPQLKLVK
jgi:hypothetical protein